MSNRAKSITNALTVDVEEHFHVTAFRECVSQDDWASLESRVERNTDRLLRIFDDAGCKGTFFILGWVAERYPAIVRKIQACGHELGCHSYAHRLIYELTEEEFRADTIRAVRAIEDAGGGRVTCYRAPSFSIVPRSAWALEILAELGFTHDSSIFPVRHDLYGFPGVPPVPFSVGTPSGALSEFPISTIKLSSARLPISGGGYLRILPMWFQKYGLKKIQESGSPFVLYLHPWEVDPDQPRIPAKLKSRLRHYSGLRQTESRLRSVLSEFKFGTMSEALGQLGSLPGWNSSTTETSVV
jgi:polysaccharide deacetylase family protein (PEP-CTERM system associated)